MVFRYQLPPPDPPPRRRDVPRALRPARVGDATSVERDLATEGLPGGDGRLVRVRRIAAAAAPAYLEAWASAGGSPLPAPEGVSAAERRRGASGVGGAPAWRLQRLAIASFGAEAVAVHWSAPEPVQADDQRAWDRLLSRLAAPRA